MATKPRVHTTALHRRPELAASLIAAAGAHGVYVHNALDAGEGEGFVVTDEDRPKALAWFGPRGNAVVVAPSPIGGAVEAAMLAGIGRVVVPWRIVMGPASILDALRERAASRVVLCRDQIYYVGDRRSAATDPAAAVRPAEVADRDRLAQATLLLNHSDLNIDPARVDRRWLRDTIDERIASGTTWVIGPVGSIRCKLDHGSVGPAGLVIEGVFTFPEHRGKGLATALVGATLAAATGPVALHVGAHNRPARAAYERAGMHAAERCRLLLLG